MQVESPVTDCRDTVESVELARLDPLHDFNFISLKCTNPKYSIDRGRDDFHCILVVTP